MKKNLYKIILSLLLMFVMQNIYAQARDSLVIQLQKNIVKLNAEMEQQKSYFSKQLSEANKNINALRKETLAEQQKLKDIIDNLSSQIANKQVQTEQQIQAEQQIHDVQQSMGKNTHYRIIIVLVIMLLSAILFWRRRLKQKSDKTDIITQLNETKSIINVEPDHSLALKVASEINLMERNISLMDTDTKGLKQLARSVDKLKNNLTANGYEIPSLLGKQFHEGMKIIIVSSIPDEKLEKGTEIISKIMVPQVNYNGIMIQTAQIEVSIG